MIRTFTIKNYKSILNQPIELGRINVFIGENGCGKTNILEAMAMAAAAVADKLDVEEIYARGVRVAKPSITFSSFLGVKQTKDIGLECVFETEVGKARMVDASISARDLSAVDVKWFNKNYTRTFALSSHAVGSVIDEQFIAHFSEAARRIGRQIRVEAPEQPGGAAEAIVKRGGAELAFLDVVAWMQQSLGREQLSSLLHDFAIFNINILALRGIQNVSRRTPLGIHGENLDVAISAMSKAERSELLDRARCVSWVDDVFVDISDELKHKGHKLGRSTSTLYFRDKFMRRRNNIFSAENVNEGILHVLFYLTLFSSASTPKVFGVDNIETALNPQLCRDMMKQLAQLAKRHDKQALITTHNPAILDGLNLHDDDQRLFIVSRNDEGHTVAERLRLKPDVKEGKLKLSELWMRGHLGGLPQKF